MGDFIDYNEEWEYRYVDTTARPWGWEVRMCVKNVISGEEWGLKLDFSSTGTAAPTKEQIDAEMLRRMTLFNPIHDEPEKIYTETEIIDLLKEKEYLTEGQTLDDLKSKTDLVAEVKDG